MTDVTRLGSTFPACNDARVLISISSRADKLRKDFPYEPNGVRLADTTKTLETAEKSNYIILITNVL